MTKLSESMLIQKNQLLSVVAEKNERLRENFEVSLKQLSASTEKTAKDLERLKYDLHELVEQKTDGMNRMFEAEMLSVKKRFNDACQGVEDAKESINSVFK